MLKVQVAHVVGTDRDEQGRASAMTMFNRGKLGVLVWAGRLHRTAEAKLGEDVAAPDYASRETVSFMSWRDVELYFERSAHASLVQTLVSQYKRNERPAAAD